MKPTRAWAVVDKRGKLADGNTGRIWVYSSKQHAQKMQVRDWGERVIEVLITPVDEESK